MHRPFSAYSGNQPFIFVSYSRKDIEMVYPELIRLKEAGFKNFRGQSKVLK